MARADDDAEPIDPAARLAGIGGRRSGGWVPEQGVPVVEVRPAEREGDTRAPLRAPARDSTVRLWVLDRAPLWSHDLIGRVTGGSLVTAGIVLTAVAVVAGVLSQRHAGSAYPTYSGGSSQSAPTTYPSAMPTAFDAAATTSIVVDVGGRVRHPGLVTLPPGARVADALAAAGGPLRHREIATLDLAAHVADGQLLLIGKSDSSPTGAAPTTPSSAAPVSLNTATLENLETLPGVGPVTAQKILDWRTAHSGFTSIEQLQQVSGIGPATYAELSPLVTP
ncbi:MAG: helix-hairpin-helix domain-containing protein [Frankiaceae bacterium]|nr:helix-hairpin-helix domain-containing protein [Frankiaceae bacterium]MBV9872091.1 helix-hairpin-helix domain-containing protein [Frankiaceae bacterium]